MAEEDVKPYSYPTLEETMLPLGSLPKNMNIHKVIGRLTLSDIVDGYNISLVNKDQMRCFKA